MNFYRNCVLCVIVMMLGCVSKENVREENPKENGFNLQQFVIVNEELQNVVNDLYFKLKDSDFSSHILMLELRMYKSEISFWFSFINKEFINYLTFKDNRRIVGYIPIIENNENIVVFSNVHNKYEFESVFYKYVQPTKNNKRFDIIYFDESQYAVDEKGRRLPPPWLITYYYSVYLSQDDQIIQLVGDTLSDFIENRKW